MAVDDWYQQFNEQRQATDQWIDALRMSTDQWVDSWRLKTEAFVKSQEEARAETRRNFKFNAELIRGVAGKESTPTPTDQETTSMSNSVPNPPVPAPTTTNLQNSASTAPNPPTLVPIASGGLGAGSKEQSATVNLSQGCNDPTISWGINIDVEAIEASRLEVDGKPEELQSEFKFSKVTFNPLNSGKIKVVSQETVEIQEVDCANHAKFEEVYLENLVNSDVMEKKLADFRLISMEFCWNLVAYKVFEEMSKPVGMIIFDPGGSFDVIDCEIGEGKATDKTLFDQFGYNLVDGVVFVGLKFTPGCPKLLPTDRGRAGLGGANQDQFMLTYDRERLCVVQEVKHGLPVTFVFDPGRSVDLLRNWNAMPFDRGRVRVVHAVKQRLAIALVLYPYGFWLVGESARHHAEPYGSLELIEIYRLRGGVWVFDPGGMLGWNRFIECGIDCQAIEGQLILVGNFVFDPGGQELQIKVVNVMLQFCWVLGRILAAVIRILVITKYLHGCRSMVSQSG